MTILIGLFLVPFAVSWLLTFVLIRWAARLGLVDQPGARKVHTQPTPRGGGLAIYVALVITACAFPSTQQRELVSCLGAGLIIVVLGLVDDLRPLPWQLRLGVQIVAAIVVVSVWPYPNLAWGVRVLSVLWIVGLVNAFNMLDNMDALSAGVAWIAAGMLALCVVIPDGSTQEWLAASPYLMFMGALSGFLWFNRPPARIFMGDAGSTFLGFFLGVGSLKRFYGGESFSPSLLSPLCILAVPCYDLCTVVVLRLWQGRSPFHADRQHLSHRLAALGLTFVKAVRLIYAMAVACGAAGLLLQVAGWLQALLVGALMVSWWVAIAGIEYFSHFHKQGNQFSSLSPCKASRWPLDSE